MPRKSLVVIEHGAVLGIDVGWSTQRPATGLCLLEWTNGFINICSCKAGFDKDDRHEKLDRLIQGKRLLAVAIDGPLVMKLETTADYRPVESLLSRGKFQRRGKPGPTNSPVGQRLHKQATQWAKLVVNTQDVAPATYRYKIHDKAIVEAFPNAFCAFLHPDSGFPSALSLDCFIDRLCLHRVMLYFRVLQRTSFRHLTSIRLLAGHKIMSRAKRKAERPSPAFPT